MAKATRTIVTKELDVDLEQQNGDPVALIIKRFLVDAQEPTVQDQELLNQHQLNVKVQKLNRRGRTIQGVAERFQYLTTDESDIFQEILDDAMLGRGRYNIFVEYRRPEESKDKVVVVRDINVGDDLPGVYGFPHVQNPVEEEKGENPLMTMLLAMMQQNQAAQQSTNKTMTDLLTALITKGADGSGKTVIESFMQGIKLAQDMDPGYEGDPEDNPEAEGIEGLWQVAKPLVTTLLAKIVAGDKAGADAAADELKRLQPPPTEQPLEQPS